MRKLLIFLILNLFYFLISCSSVKKDDSKQFDNRTVVLNLDNSYIKNLEFEASFYIKSNFGEFNLTGDVKIEGDQFLSIDFYGPFGIQLAKIYSDTSNFIAHNLFDNTVYTGSPTEENIFKATGMYLSVRHLIKIMRSELLYKSEEYISDQSQKELELFKRVDQRKFADFVVLNHQKNMKEYQRKGSDNETMFRILLDDYSVENNYKIAKSLNIVLQDKNFNFKYLAENIKVNSEASKPNKLTIPSEAKIINLNELN